MKSPSAVAIGVLAVLCAVAAVVSGCGLGSLIRVGTPTGIQQDQGLAKSLSLDDAEVQYRIWWSRISEEGAAWKANIDRGDEIRGLLGNLTLGALDSIGPAVAGIPLGGALLPFLTGAVALFVRRPGDKSAETLRKEKEESYNKGIEVGRELAAKAVGG